MEIGEKVKLVKAGPLGWESADWVTIAGLELGNVYTIIEIGSGIDMSNGLPQHYVKVDAGIQGMVFHPDHFAEVTESA